MRIRKRNIPVEKLNLVDQHTLAVVREQIELISSPFYDSYKHKTSPEARRASRDAPLILPRIGMMPYVIDPEEFLEKTRTLESAADLALRIAGFEAPPGVDPTPGINAPPEKDQ